jgi:hypothetical protein
MSSSSFSTDWPNLLSLRYFTDLLRNHRLYKLQPVWISKPNIRPYVHKFQWSTSPTTPSNLESNSSRPSIPRAGLLLHNTWEVSLFKGRKYISRCAITCHSQSQSGITTWSFENSNIFASRTLWSFSMLPILWCREGTINITNPRFFVVTATTVRLSLGGLYDQPLGVDILQWIKISANEDILKLTDLTSLFQLLNRIPRHGRGIWWKCTLRWR